MEETHRQQVCAWCGEEFSVYAGEERQYCCRNCANAAQTAPKNFRRGIRRIQHTEPESWTEHIKQAAREAKAIAKQEKQGKKAAKSQEKAVAAGDDATDGTTVTDGSQAADGSQAVGKSQAADESNESDETNESQKPQSPHESQKQSTIDEN